VFIFLKQKLRWTQNKNTSFLFCMMSLFLTLVQRNISLEIFFDSLLSDEDLSKLLCTCRGLKEMIQEWKRIFPIETLSINNSITDKKLMDMIFHYSNKIKMIVIHNTEKTLTIEGFSNLALLNSHLTDLSIVNNVIIDSICLISRSLVNLKSLSIRDDEYAMRNFTPHVFDSIYSLYGLEKLSLECIGSKVFDEFVESYRFTLNSLKSISVSFHFLADSLDYDGGNLDYQYLYGGSISLYKFLWNHQDTLVELKLERCYTLYAREFAYVSNLTNLTSLSIVYSNIDDIRLKKICSGCLLIERLDIRNNHGISRNGLDHIGHLVFLRELFLCGQQSLFNGNIGDWKWMPDLLSNNRNLCYLDLGGCQIDIEVMYFLNDFLCNRIKIKNFILI
jgi:hypothetical protein